MMKSLLVLQNFNYPLVPRKRSEEPPLLRLIGDTLHHEKLYRIKHKGYWGSTVVCVYPSALLNERGTWYLMGVRDQGLPPNRWNDGELIPMTALEFIEIRERRASGRIIFSWSKS